MYRTAAIGKSPRIWRVTTGQFESSLAAAVAQLVERVLGKDEVTGSNPVIGSISRIGAVEFEAVVL